jgi:hypothetical protein
MPVNPLPTNPAGVVNDPRYRNLLVSLSWLRPGQLPATGEFTLRFKEGEAETWYEPGYLPTLGAIQEGTLVTSSECFPRFAPLTFTIAGADLCFLIRGRQLVSFCIADGRETMMRLLCTGFWNAAWRHEVYIDDDPKRLRVRRINGVAAGERSADLELNVLRGEFSPLSCGAILASQPIYQERLFIRRDEEGEIEIQLHGARMEWVFRDGLLHRLRLFGSHGMVSDFNVIDQSGAGVTASVAFSDTLS